MISYLKYLYNNGENNGNIIIESIDKKKIKCHDFVLKNTSHFFKEKLVHLSEIYEINLEYESEIINILLNYLYSEKIVDKDLSCMQIIKLYDLISEIRGLETVSILRNFYMKKFPNLINETNWIPLLKITFGISRYLDIVSEILNYFEMHILNNNALLNDYKINNLFEQIDEQIICKTLFTISLNKIIASNEEILNKKNKEENFQKLNNIVTNYMNSSDDEMEEVEEIKPSIKKGSGGKKISKNN